MHIHPRIRTVAGALAITGLLLALPATASGGGWATVQLSSTPDGLTPGSTWDVDLEILQHGRTPMRGLHPTVTITSGDAARTFAARATGQAGAYRASVRFPAAGTWRYVVDDGFTGRHSYPPVQIGGAAAAGRGGDGSGGGIAYDRLALAGLAGIAAAALALVLSRRRRRSLALGG